MHFVLCLSTCLRAYVAWRCMTDLRQRVTAAGDKGASANSAAPGTAAPGTAAEAAAGDKSSSTDVPSLVMLGILCVITFASIPSRIPGVESAPAAHSFEHVWW